MIGNHTESHTHADGSSPCGFTRGILYSLVPIAILFGCAWVLGN